MQSSKRLSKIFSNFHLNLSMPYLIIMVKESVLLYFLMELRHVVGQMDLYVLLWLGLQIVFNFVMGFISDKYCRAKVMKFSLAMTLLSLILLRSKFYLAAVIVNGSFGNLTGIARAAHCDINISKGRDVNIANTFIVQSIPWIVFSLHYRVFHQYSFYTVLIFASTIFILSLLVFKDFRDKKTLKKKVLLKTCFNKFFHVYFGRLILAAIIWGVLWHVITYFGERNLRIFDKQDYLFLFAGTAYFIGALITRVYKFKPYSTIPFIFVFTFFIFFFNWLLFLLTDFPGELSPSTFLIFTMFIGMSRPLIFTYFGERAAVHEQGTVYGFLESIGSTAGFIGPLIISFIFPITNLTFAFFVPFLAICFLLSIKLPPFKRSKRCGY